MAGAGIRFQNAGYRVPKFAITVRGRSLFCWSLESLRGYNTPDNQFVFVVQAGYDAATFISDENRKLDIQRSSIVELDHRTDGQATTVLHAQVAIKDPEEPIMVYNIDTYVEPEHLSRLRIRGKGWIPCFRGEGSSWSFVRGDNTGRVLEVREKKRISPHATIGLYWFESFRLYREVYDSFYKAGSTLEAGERYIAPMYNRLIENGLEVYFDEIPISAVHPLGTPEDVKAFENEGPSKQ